MQWWQHTPSLFIHIRDLTQSVYFLGWDVIHTNYFPFRMLFSDSGSCQRVEIEKWQAVIEIFQVLEWCGASPSSKRQLVSQHMSSISLDFSLCTPPRLPDQSLFTVCTQTQTELKPLTFLWKQPNSTSKQRWSRIQHEGWHKHIPSPRNHLPWSSCVQRKEANLAAE